MLSIHLHVSFGEPPASWLLSAPKYCICSGWVVTSLISCLWFCMRGGSSSSPLFHIAAPSFRFFASLSADDFADFLKVTGRIYMTPLASALLQDCLQGLSYLSRISMHAGIEIDVFCWFVLFAPRGNKRLHRPAVYSGFGFVCMLESEA